MLIYCCLVREHNSYMHWCEKYNIQWFLCESAVWRCFKHYETWTPPKQNLLETISQWPTIVHCTHPPWESYIEKTALFRKKQLFLSYQMPFSLVTKQTIARWIKLVLRFRVDMTIFILHGPRTTSTSAANIPMCLYREYYELHDGVLNQHLRNSQAYRSKVFITYNDTISKC